MSLSNTQYNEIMRNYEKRQLQNRHLQEERYEAISKQIPRLEKLNRQITSISLNRAKLKIAGNDSGLQNLGNAIHDLQMEKQQLLTEHGFPSDYLDPVYTCSNCRDTGFHDGIKCHCFKQAEYALVFSQSHLMEDIKAYRFEDFSLDYYPNTLIDDKSSASSYELANIALRTCETFTEQFSNQFQNLFLYGSVGIGKTFLSNCVANNILNQGYSVLYLTAFSLFDIFQKSVFEKQIQAKEEAQHILDCDLLIIDDLGTEFANSFTTSQFFMCINERLLRKKATIISSNLDLNQLAEIYSERTFSRIALHYEVLKLFGDDIRLHLRFGKN